MANAFDSMFTPAYTNSISDTGDGAGSSPGSPQSHTYEEQDGKHTGLAGTGRDILGFLGDFLLKKIGMPAMYAPAQQQRQLDAAGQGFDQDPSAAIDRIKSVDFNRGVQMQQNQQSADSLNNYRESSEQRRLAAIADSQDKMKNRNEDRANGMLQSLFDNDGNFNAAKYAMMKPTIDKLYPGQNLPETSDGEDIRARIGGTLGAKAQIQFDQNGQKIADNFELGDRRATTGENQAQNAANRNVIYGKSVDNTGVHQGNQDNEQHVRTGIQGANSVTGAANAVSKAAGVQVQAAKLALPKKGQRLPDLRPGHEGQFVTIK